MRTHCFIAIIFMGLMACSQKDRSIEMADAMEEKKVPVDTLPVLGIDVSHFQGEVNWAEIKQARISFAYTKATQGAHYKDSKFSHNWSGAKEAGIYIGPYHFYVSDEDPIAQAENFLKVVGEIRPGEMPPVLDLEELSIKGDIDVGQFQQDALQWLKTVKEKLNVSPIIYSDPSFANQYLDHPEFGDYGLWVAEYGAKEPRIPNAWKEKGWLIWQRTDRGKIEGAIGDVDHDLFHGHRMKLEQITGE